MSLTLNGASRASNSAAFFAASSDAEVGPEDSGSSRICFEGDGALCDSAVRFVPASVRSSAPIDSACCRCAMAGSLMDALNVLFMLSSRFLNEPLSSAGPRAVSRVVCAASRLRDAWDCSLPANVSSVCLVSTALLWFRE